MTWLLLYTLFTFTAPAQASDLKSACLNFANGDHETASKCATHSQSFEISTGFVEGCTSFSKDMNTRMTCLKSGANLDILNVCRASGWSLDGMLTCLRSYPTIETMRACKKISPVEADQVNCVRFGRDSAQIESCLNMSPVMKTRMGCLNLDVPVAELRLCTKRQAEQRMDCLEDYVARRDGYERPSRGLASESQPSR